MTGLQQLGFGAWCLTPASVPAEARGRWCTVSASTPGVPRAALVHVDFLDAAGKPAGGRLHLSKRARQGVCFVPAGADRTRLGIWGVHQPPLDASVVCRPVSTASATRRLLTAHPAFLPQLARRIGPVLSQPETVRERLREVLGLAVQANAPVEDYRLWRALFDYAPDELPPDAAGLTLGVIVFPGGQASGPAMAATLGALRRQHGPAASVAVVGGVGRGGLRAALASLPGDCDYIGLLQAGEILPPHALSVMRNWVAALGLPSIAYADEDDLQAGSPLFKPEPNRALMVSGTLSRGLWLVRRELLDDRDDSAPGSDGFAAELLRLDLWLRLHEAGGTRNGEARRVPFVLTHRRPDTATPLPAALAQVVGAHLERARLPFKVAPAWPLQVTAQPLARPGRVTIIVPSALRSEQAEQCIRAVLAGTHYANFELVVAVSQPGPLDAAQLAAASRIEADSRARVLPLCAAQFNFSWVNNRAVAATAGDHVLLLNDDVSPIRPDWLDAMMAHLADAAVGVVGAKLLYLDGTVQHGGVIMGLAGLCEHAHRHQSGDAQGYAGRAVLAQELSAVTGACLLVQRHVLEQVGGLDEGYPSAFNDVDLCLRVREAGYSVVFAPEAVLHHRELHTYGSHYAAERASFEDAEVARMRTRWREVIAEDPFYSTNLSLVPGQEWELAFPPRIRHPRRTAKG